MGWKDSASAVSVRAVFRIPQITLRTLDRYLLDEWLRVFLITLLGFPILVIVTFRANSQMSWPVHEHLTTLSLGPLERDSIAAMVGSMFSVPAAPEWFATVLHERTGDRR